MTDQTPLDDGASELQVVLHVLKRRKMVILITVLGVVVTALTLSLTETPVYRATADLLLQRPASENLFSEQGGRADNAERAINTEIRVLRSHPVREAVEKKIGSAPPVRAVADQDTDIVEVSARHTNPKSAAAIANAYAEAYIGYKREKAVNELVAAGKTLQDKVQELQTQIDRVEGELTTLPGASSEAGLARRTTLEENLRASLNSYVQQQLLFKQKLDELQVDASLKSGGAQLVTPAEVPGSPVEPKPFRTGILALVLSLVVGTGLAFLLEYLDDSLKTKDDVERLLAGAPVLGLVPAVPGWKDRRDAVVASMVNPTSGVAEAYRTLRTSVQFLGLDRALGTIQITSPSAGEGKTTTLANLGVALAQAGQRVVIVCCDLRRPRVHEFFQLSREVGFTSVLLGDVPLSKALQPVPGQDRLFLLASGPWAPNPSELLSSARSAQVFDALRAQHDVVLLDCPPVLPVTDAAVLASRVDDTLVVVTAGRTTGKQLKRAIEILRQVNAPIMGAVLNGVSGEEAYGYSYSYSYEPDPPARRTQTNGKRRRVFAGRA